MVNQCVGVGFLVGAFCLSICLGDGRRDGDCVGAGIRASVEPGVHVGLPEGENIGASLDDLVGASVGSFVGAGVGVDVMN